ncbi:hypothetical protein EPN44_14340 [bacterium]|nr:MAG: hypothetical protein EPN44_14340 [bacterium]
MPTIALLLTDDKAQLIDEFAHRGGLAIETDEGSLDEVLSAHTDAMVLANPFKQGEEGPRCQFGHVAD